MERRKHIRSDAAVRVRLEVKGAHCEGFARDLSTRGIYVELDQGCLPPTVRSVRLNFEIDTGEQVLTRQIMGKIVRNETDGLAIRFADHDVLGRAVIHELMYYVQLCAPHPLPVGGCLHDSLMLTADGHTA